MAQYLMKALPNYKNAKTIDLNSIDYNNLTMADYYRIAKTLRQSESMIT
jgi:hypothetical protein